MNVPEIPGFGMTRTTYEDLVAHFHAIPGWESKLLGESVQGRPIYGFFYGPKDRPVMHVHANIHGWHEWRSCWWASGFMALLSDPSGLPGPTFDALVDIRDKYSFSFVPSVNPDGYGEYGTNWPYKNANGVSVSANFDSMWESGDSDPAKDRYRGPYPFSEPESQILRDRILDLRPASVLCLHTWGSDTEGYMTRAPRHAAFDAPFMNFYTSLTQTLTLPEHYKRERGSRLVGGGAYDWAALNSSAAGDPMVGQVFESGGGMTEEEQSRVGMTGILYHMLMVDSMLTPPRPLPAFGAKWGPIRVDGQNCPVSTVQVQVAPGKFETIWEA